MRIVLIDARAPLSTEQRERLLERLPEIERERVGRYRRWEDAQSALVGYALLLELARAELGGAEVRLTRGERDRPFLDRPAGTGVDVNMSHSGGYVAGAVCRGGRIGVDVELERKVYPGVAERCFTTGERAWMGELSEERYGPRFFQLWTLKESLVKARGDGVSSDLKAIHFDVSPRGVEVSVRGDARRWRSTSWNPAPGVWLAATTDLPEPFPAFEWIGLP